MALSREDKADVKGAMGKALASKVSKVTRDSFTKEHKKKTGHSLKSEIVSGEKSGKSTEQLLKEIRAHDAKSKTLQGKSASSMYQSALKGKKDRPSLSQRGL